MLVNNIKWIDAEEKEAIVTIKGENTSVECFSHQIEIQVGDDLQNNLECLDTYNVIVCEPTFAAIKQDSAFKYQLRGKVLSAENGIIDIDGIIVCADVNCIPNDVVEGMYIQFDTSRLDLY